jgi:hypothetical protein
MKTPRFSALIVTLALALPAFAETDDNHDRRFTVQPGGSLVVAVDSGRIDVATHTGSEVVVEVRRKVTLRSQEAEREFFADRPVNIAQDGNEVSVHVKRPTGDSWSWNGGRKYTASYRVLLPADFRTDLGTAGGPVSVEGMNAKVKARTSGGSLSFRAIAAPIDGHTSGGSIKVVDCRGTISVETSGGGIEVSGGSGELKADTAGGPIKVKDFQGPARVDTSGGSISVENIAGALQASTSGGSINAALPAGLLGAVDLSTSGGSITFGAPSGAAFNLDAATSGGSVRSDLPVTVEGKKKRSELRGPVNGGGQPVKLRTSGGSIVVREVGTGPATR